MIRLYLVTTQNGIDWCQAMVTRHHYLHSPVDSRCSPVAYLVRLEARDVDRAIGCLIFGRPEATRCYDGPLTYGSRKDVESGRCQFDRWELLNLARVWLHPSAQKGGELFERGYIPLFVDRKNIPRSTLASTIIREALSIVGFDYLCSRPPCFPYDPGHRASRHPTSRGAVSPERRVGATSPSPRASLGANPNHSRKE